MYSLPKLSTIINTIFGFVESLPDFGSTIGLKYFLQAHPKNNVALLVDLVGN